MDHQTTPTSRAIVELVRLKLGDTTFNKASDAAVARALGVSRVSISRYLHGESIMETAVLIRANEWLKLDPPELAEFALRLQAESVGHGREMILAAIAWIEAQDKYHGKTAPAPAPRRRRAGAAAVLLSAGIAALASLAPSPAQASMIDVGPRAVDYGKRRRHAPNPCNPARFWRRHRPRRRRGFPMPAALPIVAT
jgi:transcriptional regulator with XRE-family HTH domain